MASVSKETTLALAWTPASVRPATVVGTGEPIILASAVSNSPWMVRTPGLAA